MIAKTLLAALVAGLIAGVFMTAAQEARVVPLILQAEEYEGTQPAPVPGTTEDTTEHHSSLSGRSSMPGPASLPGRSSIAGPSFPDDILSVLSFVTPAHAHEGEHDDGGILFGMSRFSGTLMANLVAGAGFGLLLAGVSLVAGHPVTLANGALWGAFGWLAVHLLPSLGMPPELPGFPAAELGDRQAWWMATVLASSAGLYLVVLRPEILARAGGLLLIAAPHIYGAPQPADLTSPVPAVLGAEFAVAALATTLAFWLVLGLVSGAINDRFVRHR